MIRASGTIVDETELIVIGSQSILGAIPNPPGSLTMSMEADIYPALDPRKADVIDGAIGEGSTFHDTFGYYAQGVGPETALLPTSWRSRLHEIKNENTRGIRALCLDPHDLALAKYAAGREKDLAFNFEMAAHGFLQRALESLGGRDAHGAESSRTNQGSNPTRLCKLIVQTRTDTEGSEVSMRRASPTQLIDYGAPGRS